MSKAIGRALGAGLATPPVNGTENNILNYLQRYNIPQPDNTMLLAGLRTQNPITLAIMDQQKQLNNLQWETSINPALQQQYNNLLLQNLQNQIQSQQVNSLQPNTAPQSQTASNGLINDLDSIIYGASRALNGITYGGFDYLGNKLGIDTQMNNYLQNQAAAGMGNIVQTVGNMAELGGNILPYLVGGAVVSGPINVAYNGYKIGKAYDRLQQNPYQGQGSDVIARMRNHAGEPVVLQRGEAIPDNMGNPIVHGKALGRETGTVQNYGLDKAIYRHDISRQDAQRIPKIIKEQPVETNQFGQKVYVVKDNDGTIRLITSPTPNGTTISSIYRP